MCDYSLGAFKSREAKVGDVLVSTRFPDAFTRGFSEANGDPNVAVCLLPGTEVAFERNIERETVYACRTVVIPHSVAIFRKIDIEDPHVHHDALEFPGGNWVLVTRLAEGQRCTVLQLPAQSNGAKPAEALDREAELVGV